MQRVNPFKIVSLHPWLDIPVDLRWYRGASRWNNGCTRYGNKYQLRLIISRMKDKVRNPEDQYVPGMKLNSEEEANVAAVVKQ